MTKLSIRALFRPETEGNEARRGIIIYQYSNLLTCFGIVSDPKIELALQRVADRLGIVTVISGYRRAALSSNGRYALCEGVDVRVKGKTPEVLYKRLVSAKNVYFGKKDAESLSQWRLCVRPDMGHSEGPYLRIEHASEAFNFDAEAATVPSPLQSHWRTMKEWA